jgi:Flp pilus assembly protein TadG
MKRRSRRGSAILEFALAAIVLFPCVGATFQFGYSFYVYNQLESAISSGARYASMRTYRSLNGDADYAKIQAAVKNVVVYGNPTGSGTGQVPGLTTGNVAVAFSPRTAGTIPNTVTVSISSFAVNAVFKTYTLTGKPSVVLPYVGRYAPVEAEP